MDRIGPNSPRSISTPDQRLRVFVSSTLGELKPERDAARSAVEALRLTPVMFELGARPHPPADVYRSYLNQSDVFIGIYWESYGWVAPGETISGIDDEYRLSSGMPRLIYVKEPAPERDTGLVDMLDLIRADGAITYRHFTTPEELKSVLLDDLAVLVSERFHSAAADDPMASGTLSFLFADIEGSTGLLRRLGSHYPRLLSAYHRIVNRAVVSRGGHVASTEGDGFFCVFRSASDAVESAIAIQQDMRSEVWPEGEEVRCRMAVHTGTAERTMEGYVGIDVHIAARIGAAAQGGQIVVSPATAMLLEEYAPAHGWDLVDLGQYELAGVGRNVRLHRVDSPGIPIVATPPRARPRVPSSVPTAPRRLVGREDDLAGASEMLMRDAVRLVTLTGMGGTGKTRLAIELAATLDDQFPDGVVFVDLSAVSDPDRFLPVVGRALGVRESAERSIVAGLQTVVGDSKMLLVLDNMEHLLETAYQVGEMIEALPSLKILATSRSPLRIAWEHEYPVVPLPLPLPGANPEDIDSSESVVLFMERAQAVRPFFELNEVTRDVVAEVVRRLDGLPLAIELAAARLRVFTIEELRDRLDDRFGLLDKASPGTPERHRTLRNAIQWSYDLLREHEQIVFRRLSVFAGGWTLQSAIAVCADNTIRESELIDILEDLVAKSLIVFTIDDEGIPRYTLLETLREFGLAEMQRAWEETAIRLRHLAWCRSLAERELEVVPTPDFPAYLDQVEKERFNMRAALSFSVATRMGTDDALLIVGMLPLFFDTRGYVAEGLRWVRALIAMTTTEGVTHQRAIAHTAMGWLEMLAGEGEESDWAFETAVEMFRELGDDAWLARTLSMNGMTTYNRGRLDDAQAQFEEAIRLCIENDLNWLAEGWCVYGLAHLAMARSDYQEAARLLHQCLEYSRDHGLTWGVGHTQLSLGVLAFMMGETGESIARVCESLTVRRSLRDWRGLCDCVGLMALHASVGGNHRMAARLIGAADVAREASGELAVPWLEPMIAQAVESARIELGQAGYETELMIGRELTMEQALDLIMAKFGGLRQEPETGPVPVEV